MKKIKMILMGLFALLTVPAFAQTADDIMQKVKDTLGGFGSGASMAAQANITVTDKNGNNKTPMVIRMYANDDADGNNRTTIEFLSPKDPAETRFLTKENSNGSTSQWIYESNLQKTRRIVASTSGGAFMGTDFSFDDLSVISSITENTSHSFANPASTTLGGNSCSVIESIPADQSKQYQKMLSYVGKSDNRIYQIDLYTKQGDSNPVKRLQFGSYQLISGRQTPLVLRITTLSTGSYTTIQIPKGGIAYDISIPDVMFNENYLDYTETEIRERLLN
jgi:outer membrane lipoprotein-sorting protein